MNRRDFLKHTMIGGGLVGTGLIPDNVYTAMASNSEKTEVSKKCLVFYESRTGNTDKVAAKFKSTFVNNGWKCDMFKVDKETDIMNPPFDFDDYYFVCVGSGLRMHSPYMPVVDTMRAKFFGRDPRPMYEGHQGKIEIPVKRDEGRSRGTDSVHRKIVFGCDPKYALVFITYSGYDFGPKEAEPALNLLALEIEHLKFQCIGRFSCPGRFMNDPTPYAYHGDIRDRPNEEDLKKVEFFIEENLEKIADRSA
jgi:hypothetical protein